MRKLVALTLIVLFTSPAFAVRPKRVHVRHHHSKWNPLFWPSHLSLLLQNKEINDNGLARYQDMEEVQDAVARGELVPLPLSDALTVDRRLDPRRRYVRPWTAQFLTDISNQFYAQFHIPIMVDSAVRPRDVQKKLRRRNHNAAPIDGETASSHMAGLTVDLARSYMNVRQTRWMEVHLLILHSMGLVEVEEEHRQLCFHIMVAKKYGDPNRVTIETESAQVPQEFQPYAIEPTDTNQNSPSLPPQAGSDADHPNDPGPRRPLSGDSPLAGPGLSFPWI